jgi:glycosyltransferase involved in cell wall biosynthesis
MTRTRVLHVGKFYPPAPGGMERVVQLLCEGERPAVESRVLVANTGRGTVRERWQGIEVTRVGSVAAIGSVGVCPAFPFELRRAERDVTVIHEPNPLAIVSDWMAAQNGPLVVWFHSEVLRPRWKYRLLYRPFLRRVLARADRIVVSSPRLAEHAVELQDYREKCVVIPFGIDTGRLTRTPAIDERVASIERAHPGPRVLFVGRLVPYKGVDVLLEAMRSVQATALIVGDGPLRQTLEAMAERLGLSARVRFVGHVEDEEVVAHMHACDLFVLPSVTRAETFGVVQLEAMACGKPVVSTNLPTGVPWVNRHEETGLVVGPGDATALAGALNRLIADPALRARLGTRARQRVEETFTVERMRSRAEEVYRGVIGSSLIAYRQSHRSIAQSSIARSSIARSIDSIDRSIDAIGDKR